MRLDLEIDRRYQLKDDKGFFRPVEHSESDDGCIIYPGRRERFVHVKPDDHDLDTRNAIIRHYVEVTQDE